MPHHQTITVAGSITHVFGHRFVVQTAREPLLADLTPKGLEQVTLHVGDSVELTGESRPSELKVTRFTRDGQTVTMSHREKHHHQHGEAAAKDARKAARNAGFAIHGEPRRKPKHFEILGERDGRFTELHVELAGHIRKMKPVDRHDPKWANTIGT